MKFMELTPQLYRHIDLQGETRPASALSHSGADSLGLIELQPGESMSAHMHIQMEHKP